MNRAVRTTVPPLVSSLTSTSPRLTTTSTRRPARVALTSYVRVSPPVSMTIAWARGERLGNGELALAGRLPRQGES